MGSMIILGKITAQNKARKCPVIIAAVNKAKTTNSELDLKRFKRGFLSPYLIANGL